MRIKKPLNFEWWFGRVVLLKTTFFALSFASKYHQQAKFLYDAIKVSKGKLGHSLKFQFLCEKI